MRWKIIKAIWMSGTCPQDEALLYAFGWALKATICVLLGWVESKDPCTLPTEHVVVAVMAGRQTQTEYGAGADWDECSIVKTPWYSGWTVFNYSNGYP